MKKAVLMACCIFLIAGRGMSTAQDTTGNAQVDVEMTEGVMTSQGQELHGGNSLTSTTAPGANTLSFAADVSISPVGFDQGVAAVGLADDSGNITGPAVAVQTASSEAAVDPADTNPLLTGSMAHSHSYLLENQFQASAAAGNGVAASSIGTAENGHTAGTGVEMTTMGELDFDAANFVMKSEAATTGFASRLGGAAGVQMPGAGQTAESAVFQAATAVETAAWQTSLNTAWDDLRWYSGDTIDSGFHVGWFNSETSAKGYATAKNVDGTASFDAANLAAISHKNTIFAETTWSEETYFPWHDVATNVSLNLSTAISGAPVGQGLVANTAGDPVFAVDQDDTPVVDPNGNPIVESGGYASLSSQAAAENVGGYEQIHHLGAPMHHYAFAKINLTASTFQETDRAPLNAVLENAPELDTTGDSQIDVTIKQGSQLARFNSSGAGRDANNGLIDSSCQGNLTTQPGAEGSVEVGNLDESGRITGPAAARTSARGWAKTMQYYPPGIGGYSAFETGFSGAVENRYQADIYASNGAAATFDGGALAGRGLGQSNGFVSDMSVAPQAGGDVFESHIDAVALTPRVGHFIGAENPGSAPLPATVETHTSGADQTAGGKMYQQASVFQNGYNSGRYDTAGHNAGWTAHQQYIETSSKTTGYAAIADAGGAASFVLAPQNLNDFGEFAPGNIVHGNRIRTANLWSGTVHSATGSMTLSSRLNGIPAAVTNTAGAPVFALDANGNHTHDENQCVNIESGGFASIHNKTTASNYGGYEQWVEINGDGATGYMYQNASTKIDLSRTIYKVAQ